ncbi:MAG TPA: DUF4198 domain-containing protein [Thermoanaerobaculia bacterium]|nr:DUF4198 domain-containing protein [Thermoanaerobaculia bacterium]
MTRFLPAAAALLFAAALQAHDFWIEPSTFHPAAGMTVAVGLRVGQNFVGDPVPRTSPYIERFVVKQGRTEEPINGIDNTDPAGWFTADGRVPAVIAYRSKPSRVEQPAAKFEDYLRQQGLERIIALRAQRGERARSGTEIFSRCAKAILTGERPSIAVTQPMGLRYEIVPEGDPTFGGAPFRGRVVYERTPASGMLVEAIFLKQPSIRMATRSGQFGRFSFALPRAGVWLIKSVQMVDAPRGANAEWESLWASLTFDAPRAEGRP